jgi:hypothetical protein
MLVKKFKDYDFTSLNAEVSKVLMEIKKDPEFRQPPKIPIIPHPHNKDKYCDFNEATGYHAEGLMSIECFTFKPISLHIIAS